MRNGFWGLALLALVLTGCQTTHEQAGSGFVYLSKSVEYRFQSYLANPNATYFAISTDGRQYGYSVCAQGPYSCTESGGAVALRSCRNRSPDVPCKIYAVGDRIVWQGVGETGEIAERVSTEPGSGPIELSSETRQRFEKYLSLDNPEFFAVSMDGQFSGYSFCRNPPCVDPGVKALAVSSCVAASSGEECRIYAVGREVVWK